LKANNKETWYDKNAHKLCNIVRGKQN
jgi:hypothetical protein